MDIDRDDMEALLNDPRFKRIFENVQKKQVRQQSTIEQYMSAVRERHSDEQVKQALAWTLAAFADLIEYDVATKQGIIIFVRIKSTPSTREMKMTTSPDGFTITRAIKAEYISLYYIDIILDEEIQSDEAKIMAMIEKSKSQEKGELHPEFNFLLEGRGRGGKMKLELWTHEFE